METSYRVRPLLRDDPEALGAYRLVGRLGSGGMGVVYLAEDREGRYVAVKLVHANLADDPEFRNRFRSEVERARQVPSFCTAEVLDVDLDHHPPYLVVEYVDGPSLAEIVSDRGPLTGAKLQSVAVGMATALAGIHGAGVIHRDLKPENVLLPQGSPKVIDFGIARAFDPTSAHTATDQFVGTVAYMAPERFATGSGATLTAAADVFSWGCVVGYAGTGRTPFHGDSPQTTAARILTQPPLLSGLPQPLRGLVELALAKNPADRPSAHELLTLLVNGRGAPQPAAHSATEVLGGMSFEQARDAMLGNYEPPAAPFAPAPRGATVAPPPVSASVAELVSKRALDRRTTPAGAGPAGPAGRTPASTAPPGRPRRGRQVLIILSVLLVLAGFTAAGVILNDRATPKTDVTAGQQPGGGSAAGEPDRYPPSSAPAPATSAPPPSSAPPSSRPPAPAPATPKRPPGKPEPTGGEPIIQDPLSSPGQWLDSEIREQNANCFTRGVMRAGRVDRGTYQCAGPEEVIADDFRVEVTTALQSAGSCAAIWFHWDQNHGGGHVARFCADEFSVAGDFSDDRRVFGRLSLSRKISLKKSTRVHVAVRGTTVDFWRDGGHVGTVKLPSGGVTRGQVQLGLSVETLDDPAPYAVTFANVDIRSI